MNEPTSPRIRNNNLVFSESTDLYSAIDQQLKARYGRGVFVQDDFTSPDKTLTLKLGFSYAKDVSDRLERDKVIKYINVGDVYRIQANPTGQGYYIADLPDRNELLEAFDKRKKSITDRLDHSMAKTIFHSVYQLPPVSTQLNPINQIARWIAREGELHVDRIDRAQGSDNTNDYLRVLEDFDYIRRGGNIIRPGEKMEAHFMDDFDNFQSPFGELSKENAKKFQQTVVGHIVNDTYATLRDQFELNMLNHFPKFANSYYFSALQKNDPDLNLRLSDLAQNLHEEWGDEVDTLVLEDKVGQLDEAEVLEWDGEFVSGETEVLSRFRNHSNTLGVAAT